MRGWLLVLAAAILGCAPPGDAPGAGELLLVGNKGENTLSLIALADGRELARLPTGPMPHEIAVSPDGKQAAVVAYGGSSIDVFDLASRAKLPDIVTGGRPEGIALARGGKEVWVGDLSAPRVQAFDTATGERIAEVAVDPVAIRVAATPDGMTVATGNIGAGTISVIDVATRKVTRTIKVSGEASAGQVTLLFSSDGKRLYAAETGRNQIAEIDFASGTVLRRLTAGKNGDGLALAPTPAPTSH